MSNEREIAPRGTAGCSADAPIMGPDRADRLTPAAMAAHEFGSIGFGEKADAVIDLPANRGLEAATVHVRVDGDPSFRLSSMWAVTLPSRSQTCGGKIDVPRVVYSPRGPGSHRARLVFVARWPDGHRETQAITLSGSSSTPAVDDAFGPDLANRLSRLAVPPGGMDIGEQIVGSRHAFRSRRPRTPVGPWRRRRRGWKVTRRCRSNGARAGNM